MPIIIIEVKIKAKTETSYTHMSNPKLVIRIPNLVKYQPKDKNAMKEILKSEKEG